MPSYYNIVRPGDVDSAVSRASKEIVMNGFGSVLSPTTSACMPGAAISICAVTGKSDDLQVTITQTMDLVLLSGLGVQPVTLSATAQAEYLPPIQIGARLNYFGDQVECYDQSGDTTFFIGSNSQGIQDFTGSFDAPPFYFNTT